MDFIIKILKLKITKIFLFLLTIALILSVYFYKSWYSIQYHKALGFYYVHKADKAYKQKKYQKAVDLYKAALIHYPGHSRASCNLGNIYVSFENYSEAVKYYENALQYSPDFMVCRINLGIILSEKRAEYDRAVKEYESAANAKPLTVIIPFVYNNAEAAKKNRGIAYYNAGIAYRNKSLLTGSGSPAYKKYIKLAEKSYQNAEKYLKNNFDNTFNLAVTAHLAQDYQLAEEKYCEAVNLNPENFDAHFNFAVLLIKMKKNQEALNELEKSMFLAGQNGYGEKNLQILGIINEVKRRMTNKEDAEFLKKHKPLTSLNDEDIIYSNGKITAENQKDIDLKQLMKCTFIKKKSRDSDD